MTDRPNEFLNWNPSNSNVMKPSKTILENGGINEAMLPAEWHSWGWNLTDKWLKFLDYLSNKNKNNIATLRTTFEGHNHDNIYAKKDGSTNFEKIIINGTDVLIDDDGNLIVGGIKYLSIDEKESSPAIKIYRPTITKYRATRQGITKYGFLSTTKPDTKTLKINKSGIDYYLNQPYYTSSIDEYFGIYRRGDQNRIIGETLIFNNTLSMQLYLNVRSQPEGSHRGHNRSCNSYTIVKVYDEQNLVYENKQNQWTFIGGDNKISFTNKSIYIPEYDKPHRIELFFRFDLGGYEAHMDSERYWTSVINNFKFHGSKISMTE